MAISFASHFCPQPVIFGHVLSTLIFPDRNCLELPFNSSKRKGYIQIEGGKNICKCNLYLHLSHPISKHPTSSEHCCCPNNVVATDPGSNS